MMDLKPIKVDNKDLKEAIQSNNPYIQIDGRKFLLMEVNEVSSEEIYEVTDPDEEKQLLRALNEDNPIVSDDEISKMLRY